MTIANSSTSGGFYLINTLKSILIWSFVLAVCMIVIGFPVLVLVVSVGSLMAVIMHAMMPINGLLYMTAAFVGVHIVGIVGMSSFLTFKGIYPQEIEWLRWLHGQENPINSATYASCPLTCDMRG